MLYFIFENNKFKSLGEFESIIHAMEKFPFQHYYYSLDILQFIYQKITNKLEDNISNNNSNDYFFLDYDFHFHKLGQFESVFDCYEFMETHNISEINIISGSYNFFKDEFLIALIESSNIVTKEENTELDDYLISFNKDINEIK